MTLPIPGAEGVTLPLAARRYLFGREVQVQAVICSGGIDATLETSNALRIRVER
jgi:hypothetical protein